jgi:uncharacterized protein (TIGR03435 family)
VQVSLSAINANNDVARIASSGMLNGYTVRAAIAHLHGTPPTRVVWPEPLDDDRPFDFALRQSHAKSRDEALDQALREGIDRHYRLKTRREARLVDAYVLTTENGTIRAARQPGPGRTFALASSVEIGLAHDADDETSGPTRLSGTVSMPLLCTTLEHLLGRPVVDETQLEGSYRIVMDLTGDTPDELIDALRAQLNLTLALVQRELEMLVVELDR